MFVAKKQDATSEAQSGALYAPQNPISQRVRPGNGIERNHKETYFGLMKWIGHVRYEKTRRNFRSTKWCIVCTPKPDLTKGTSRQRNRAKPPRNLVLGLKKRIGHVRCEKTRRNFGSTKWCILCTPKPDLTTGTSRQRNRVKPPRNLVLGLKK